MKIQVVDDDHELRGLIGFTLRRAGYLVIETADGIEALALFEREQPDLVILDVNLPGKSGFEVCREIRERAATPIMMLTVRNSEEDEVQGLDLGADDYLTKPFSPRSLLARVRALLRRSETESSITGLNAGSIALDAERRTVRVRDSAPVHLTPLEFRLLQYLVVNADRVVSVERLTQHVWGYRGVGDRQLLKQLVHRMRQKIEVDAAQPRYLINLPGVGYMLATGGEELGDSP